MSETILLTVHEVSKVLNISLPTVYKLCHSQDFPALKIGRSWRVNKDLLNDWASKKALEDAHNYYY